MKCRTANSRGDTCLRRDVDGTLPDRSRTSKTRDGARCAAAAAIARAIDCGGAAMASGATGADAGVIADRVAGCCCLRTL